MTITEFKDAGCAEINYDDGGITVSENFNQVFSQASYAEIADLSEALFMCQVSCESPERMAARLAIRARSFWTSEDGEQALEKSTRQYRIAAALGSEYAKYKYAIMCYEGIGTPADPELGTRLCQSLSWWRAPIISSMLAKKEK